jgi:hypothetical protein
MAAKSFKRDPMKTKAGKIRLGPLNIKQLNEMLNTCRPKHKMKIQRRIQTLIKYGHKVEEVVVE